jgi:hypothetical protein
MAEWKGLTNENYKAKPKAQHRRRPGQDSDEKTKEQIIQYLIGLCYVRDEVCEDLVMLVEELSNIRVVMSHGEVEGNNLDEIKRRVRDMNLGCLKQEDGGGGVESETAPSQGSSGDDGAW